MKKRVLRMKYLLKFFPSLHPVAPLSQWIAAPGYFLPTCSYSGLGCACTDCCRLLLYYYINKTSIILGRLLQPSDLCCASFAPEIKNKLKSWNEVLAVFKLGQNNNAVEEDGWKEECWSSPGIPNVKVLLLGTDRPAINSSNNNNFIYWAPFCC